MYHLIDYVWCVEKFGAYLDRHAASSNNATSQSDSSGVVGGQSSDGTTEIVSNNITTTTTTTSSSSQQVFPLLTSPVFAYKNTRWVLNLYPEGLGDSSSAGYVSLFIKYVSEEPESICAKVLLSLLNNKNERVHLRDTGDHAYQTFIDFG